MTLSFVETTGFTQSLSAFFADDEAYRLFQNDLIATPERGDVIRATGGLRKIRWADPRRGKGTRGGIRIVYLFIPEARIIFLLRAYNKDKQDDLSEEQRKLNGIYDDLLGDLEEALLWTRGEKSLKVTRLTETKTGLVSPQISVDKKIENSPRPRIRRSRVAAQKL